MYTLTCKYNYTHIYICRYIHIQSSEKGISYVRLICEYDLLAELQDLSLEAFFGASFSLSKHPVVSKLLATLRQVSSRVAHQAEAYNYAVSSLPATRLERACFIRRSGP